MKRFYFDDPVKSIVDITSDMIWNNDKETIVIPTGVSGVIIQDDYYGDGLFVLVDFPEGAFIINIDWIDFSHSNNVATGWD